MRHILGIFISLSLRAHKSYLWRNIFQLETRKGQFIYRELIVDKGPHSVCTCFRVQLWWTCMIQAHLCLYSDTDNRQLPILNLWTDESTHVKEHKHRRASRVVTFTLSFLCSLSPFILWSALGYTRTSFLEANIIKTQQSEKRVLQLYHLNSYNYSIDY